MQALLDELFGAIELREEHVGLGGGDRGAPAPGEDAIAAAARAESALMQRLVYRGKYLSR